MEGSHVAHVEYKVTAYQRLLFSFRDLKDSTSSVMGLMHVSYSTCPDVCSAEAQI